MSVTQEIKNRLDIADVVSDYLPLRKSGRSLAGFCPFHPNTRTPAFYVFPESQTWHCFGACAEGGDLFSFVMKKEGWDFKEALVQMANRAGVKLEEHRPVDKVQQDREQKLTSLLTSAADYFHQLLLHAPQAEQARQYISERALNTETVALFRVGFSLDSWNACRTHFNSQGYSDDELLEAGLMTENPDKGTRYDRFRNRLMIPIQDGTGSVVGFGARTLDKDGIPKYLNSPQTPLFNKSHLLFGLDGAKPFIREARQVVIVEGYMDVMQAWQAGFRNVVAQMGTALTEQQLRTLKRYTKRFILALDADAAGQKATMRGLQVARETLDREIDVRFDARGLVRHEGRLQADIRVVTLPEGNDPDKIIRTNRDAWPKLLKKAKPVVAFVIDTLTRDLDKGDAKAKTTVAQQVLPVIKDIGDPIERDHYWQLLASSLGVDERALRQLTVPQQRRRSTTASAKSTPPNSQSGTTTPGNGRRRVDGRLQTRTGFRQANFLRQCIHYPQILSQVNQILAQRGQEPVTEADFVAVDDRALLPHLSQRANLRTVVTIEQLCDSLDELLVTRVKSLLTVPPTPESEQDRLADTLVLSILDWRLDKIKQLLSEVKQLFLDAKQTGDTDALVMYQQQLQELPMLVLKINRARDAMSSVSRRRAEGTVSG